MDKDLIEVTSFLSMHEQNITNGSSKLSLTASLLHKINLALQESEYTQDVLTHQSSLRNKELKILCDIIRKVPKLTITQTKKSKKWRVDVSRFEKLQYIELHNIPIHVVEGIKSLRHQLRVLICINVSDSIIDILGYSDLWEELHTAKLCCNGFGSLIQSYNTPWLQYLDLSCNKLKGKIVLQTLKNLKYLNLSFNCLDSLPVLHEDAYRSLKVILLNNNLIEDLSLIHMFSVLEELDVSYNILADHSALQSVVFLSNLVRLNLSNNPISYHPYHRLYTCHHVNESVILNHFFLDGRQLNTAEKKEIFRSRYIIDNAFLPHHGSSSSSAIINQSVIRTRFGRKVRDVCIKSITTDSKQNSSLISPKTNKLILQTTIEIKELIKTFIRAYPLVHDSTFSQVRRIIEFNVERIKTTYPCYKMYSSFPKLPEITMDYQNSMNQPDYSRNSIAHTAKSSMSSILIHNELKFLYLRYCDKLHDDLLAAGIDPDFLSSNDGMKIKLNNNETKQKMVAINTSKEINTAVTDDESISSEDTFDELLIAQKELQDGSFLYVLVALDESYIREKCIINGRTLITWSLRSVGSCDKLTFNPPTVRLVFNRVHRECRERIYVMEHLDAEKLLKKVRSVLEAQSLSSMNLNVYHCLNCTSTFSQELQKSVYSPMPVYFNTDISKQGLKVKCFMCGSTLVIIEEDHPRNDTDISIASDYSSNKARTAVPSPEQITDMESGTSRWDTIIELLSSVAEFESDIEVISNSSQSSIEVIELQAHTHDVLTESSLKNVSKVEESNMCSLESTKSIGEYDRPGNFLTEDQA